MAKSGFSLLEMIFVLALGSLLLIAGLTFFQHDRAEQQGYLLQQNLQAKLYYLRHQAMYQGQSKLLTSADVADMPGVQWQQRPLLGFAASGYPSKAGTLIFQAGKHLRKLVVTPASGAIKLEIQGL